MRGQRLKVHSMSAGEQGRPDMPVSLFKPYWREAELSRDGAESAYDRHIVMLFGWDEAAADELQQRMKGRMKGIEIVRLHDPWMPAGQFFEHCTEQVHETVQGLLKSLPKGRVLLQVVLPLSRREEHQPLSGLYAYLRTAQAEQPRLIPQLIEVGTEVTAEALGRLLQDNGRFSGQGRFRYKDGKRWTAGWMEEEHVPVRAPLPWREQGVYLITGGAGGLGMIVAREIVRQTDRPVVILAGRSALNPDREKEITLLRQTGAVVEYRRADLSRSDEAEELVQSILKDFGKIHGILHSAGTVSDSYILNKTKEELRRVLAPKVSGLVNLDRASRGTPLEFFVLFSSLAGAVGNPGQADYAAANAYMDAYAAYRNTLVSARERQGHTLSINWPLWKEGGMQADEQRMLQQWGMTALETEQGLQAMYQALALGSQQVLIIPRNADLLRDELLSWGERAASGVRAAFDVSRVPDYLKEGTGQCLRLLFGEATALEPSKIDLHEPLESYGIDSLLINQLNQKLETVFGDLSKTLFYEYQTLGELADYLSSSYPEACMRWADLPGPTHASRDGAGAAAAGEEPFPHLVSLRKGRTGAFAAAAADIQSPKGTWEPIAVIGMSGTYPQARNLRAYWENLKAGKDCITEIPEERWSLDGFYHPDPEEAAAYGMSCSRWGGFLEGYADFDPLFFHISPREAMNMDPQERLFLQSCWEALEDAGYTRQRLALKHNRRVGVFAGITKTGYELYGPGLWERGDTAHPYTSFSSVANRVSYFLNLSGPSLPVDTMCSSSLTAIHEACGHLHRGECEMALAGGVNLYLHPSNYSLLSGQNMLSKDGKCRSFGKGANGFVPGEGVGVVLLKPLSRALLDQDPIHAVIRSTSVNHGGKTNGYTVPNPIAQAELVRTALDQAGVDARCVSYVEAHGTGTELGDPIEITGLTRAFARDTQDTGFCAIGSAKSNIGHLEAAAGIAGLTKIILQMKHRMLVPSLHAEETNPNIPFGRTPFVVQQKLEPWKQPEVVIHGVRQAVPRTAGISSFGAGGSNAHVLLEEYVTPAAKRPGITYSPEHPAIIPLSAKTEERLRKKAEELLEWLREEQEPSGSLASLAYTLQAGREAMEARLAVLAGSLEELQRKLREYLEDTESMEVYIGRRKTGSQSESGQVTGEILKPGSGEPDPDAIARWWASGGDWDWDLLYGEETPCRISLPVYPFAGERYFIGEHVQGRKGQTKDADIESRALEGEQEASEAAGVSSASAGRGWIEQMRGFSLKQCLEWDLKSQIGQLLCIAPEQLDPEENLADFGFDSISLARLAAVLTKHWDIEVLPSLFFGHPTIDKIIEYFLSEHETALGLFYREPKAGPAEAASLSVRTTERRPARPARHGAADEPSEPIAIIGMSGRFPGARTVEELWTLLAEGKSAVGEIPPERFRWEEYYASGKSPGKTDGRWCGCIPGAGEFDPLFFEISPKEAEEMDPRQRLLLQEAWRALEHAGYGASRLKSSTVGMFVGAEQGDYQRLTGGEGSITSNHNAILAARLSYFLNLTGPVLALDTACSSGLAAAHQACLSLRSGECDTALAAGVNLLLTPEPYIGMTQAGMLSKDGRCYAFDQRANGLVPGEAVAVVVLKRLSQAEADGDRILAVIRGSGLNYDGRTNGITAPSGSAQAELLKSVYTRSGVDPAQIEYVVTHGTGTRLGDPIEMNALHQAFKEYTSERGSCAVTSNKTNLGHTFAASGLVSLINLVLAFRYETVPASLHVEEENDFIPWQDTPFYVNKESRPWPERPEGPRTGAVSAFGMSGTNVHMVLQSYAGERTEQPAAWPPFFLFVLSAKTQEALDDKVRDLIEVCRGRERTPRELLDIAYTLIEGRHHFGYRTAVVVRDGQDAVTALRGSGSRGRLASRFDGIVPRDFAGQPLLQKVRDELLAGAADLMGQDSSYREALCTLADLYCQGYALDGGALYGWADPRTAELPGYPFARDTYWVSSVHKPAAQGRPAARKAVLRLDSQTGHRTKEAVRNSDSSRSAEPFELMTFRETWKEQALAASPALRAKTLLCFVSEAQNKEAVREAVRSLRAETELIFISRDSEDVQYSPHDYGLNTADAASYTSALQSIGTDHPNIDAVLYLWPLEAPGLSADYHAVFSLVKALSLAKLKPARLLLAGGFENPLQRCYLESWIGIVRSLSLVLPQVRASAAAVDRQGERSWGLPEALPHLLAELGIQDVPGVLYQEGRRHVGRITPTTPDQGISVWRPGGTYLLTGGCGGLGLLTAEYVAGRQEVNLILTGRSPLTEEKRSRIAALERTGSRVLYVQADIGDRSEMQKGLQTARERFGPIHGILHAAGVTSGLTVLEKTIEEAEQVLSPKIAGTLILDELLQEEPLDFVCYFSSSAAVLGDFGSCDYAAANRFQTAYARTRRERGLPGRTVVMNWPLWKDGGMGFTDESSTQMYLKSSGQRLLEAAEGMELLDRALSQPEDTQHLVLAGQRTRVVRFLGLPAENEIPSVPLPERMEAGRGWREVYRGMSLEQCLERDLKELISSQLKIPRDKLDERDNLADFGYDSILLAAFAEVLTRHFGMDITPAVFFGNSTIHSLAGYFTAEHLEAVQAFYREPAPAPADLHVPPAASSGEGRAAFRRMKRRNTAAASPLDEPIAIIGMSGRFPGARDTDEMWRILAEGIHAVQEVPVERFDWRRYAGGKEEESGRVHCRWCGTLPGVAEFDPLFFDIPPKEAETMDPRQRLLLQESWKALEDAGYGTAQIREGRIGMFVGVEEGDYQLLAGGQGNLTSTHTAILAARLSYVLNLSGPNMAINTACSSGLVAAHQACLSLRNGECDTALAAGVNLMLTPDAYEGISRAGIVSPDGKCYAFDGRANGTVPGEAAAVVVLKRLSQAEADGDPIYAVIRGSGINYDGKTNGITAPSGVAQARLYREIYDRYRIRPEEIEYIVTHGTGTKLGDPVEINALNQAFKAYTDKQAYCALTSAKTNFGHTFAASGLVSLMNLVLALRHGYIPASLHCEQENPYMDWQGSPFYVNKEGKVWEAGGRRVRTGAVSAFGMSGTNAHMVLESYEGKPGDPALVEQGRPPYYLLALSAKTEEALQEKVRSLAAVMPTAQGDADLLGMSYTLLQGRQHFAYRCAVVIQERQDALVACEMVLAGERLPNLFKGRVPREFTGQKAIRQYMEELMIRSHAQRNEEAAYRETLLALADLYCQGYEPDWSSLFGKRKPGKLRLPTYPFARDIYWVKRSGAGKRAESMQDAGIEEPPFPVTESFRARAGTGGSGAQSRPAESEEKAIRPTLQPLVEVSAAAEPVPSAGPRPLLTVQAASERLKELLQEVTGIPYDRMEDGASFEELGLDSLMITQLNQQLKKWIGRSDSTLFYQYNSIQALGTYLAETSKAADVTTGFSSASAQAEDPAPRANGPSLSILPAAERSSAPVPRADIHGPALEFVPSPLQLPARSASEPVDIAIVGVAGRYPKADTLEQFWNNLYEGRDCIEEIPRDRWPLEGFFEEDRKKAVEQGLSYSKWGGFLERVRHFDPLFFNISPKEAMYMDPQERLFLETAWACMENAGYTRDGLKREGLGSGIGVFVGATFNNYQLHMADAAHRSGTEAYLATSQMFSIANRVSYLMNFTGPSLTVDTACSSSLYAIHLACESIRSGQSRAAIAGGVNLTLHPSKYITLCQGQFSASDGRCRAFGEGGTGYVPSEGVGAVFLKPLHEAVSDKDWIYGVIKGTAVSHAGRTNGYTVPSPSSQSQAIEQALERSGIHPRSISCIEAHGTGTALGDPIEIRGLTDVFGKYTEDTGFCAISSVKSNVGHAEAAAGIAQLTKVLLQLRHETLVKNVMHGHGLNPNIDFASTPFVVQQETAYWQRPVIHGEEMPRRAGISSFGAGGANAHIVVEEYPPSGFRAGTPEGVTAPALVVLSARTEDRLRAQAERLLHVIREHRFTDADLPGIAFTLQVGREAMEERAAVLVGSIQELEAKLQEFTEGRQPVKGLFRGQVKRGRETVALFEADEDMQELLGKWFERGSYAKLLELWTKGLGIDWMRLYPGTQPGRIPLPAYPFAGEAYWVPESETPPPANKNDRTGTGSGLAAAGALHPLLQRNISDITGIRFSSVFTGREFFLRDHVVKGQPVLPGVAYLEMARAAAEHGAGLHMEGGKCIRLRNVVWARPIVVEAEPVEVHVELFSGDRGALDYEVSTSALSGGDTAQLHSQGSVLLDSFEVRPSWDLAALRAEFGQETVPSARIYDAYASMGIGYGPAHQGIRQVNTKDGRVLAQLCLPDAAAEAGKGFILHPSLMDSALQATLALMLRPGKGDSETLTPGLPFALGELEIYGNLPPEAWVLIRYSEGSRPGDRVQKLDIDLIGDNGLVCVRMKGFSTRTLESPAQPSSDAEPIDVLLLEPVWNELPAAEGTVQAYEKHLIVLCETGAGSVPHLRSRLSSARCLVLGAGPASVGERFAAHCTRIFEEVRALLAEKSRGKVLVQIVIPPQTGEPLAGLSGLIMAAQSENGKLVGQVIESEAAGPVLADQLMECSHSPLDKRIRYRQDRRWTGGWAEITREMEPELPWKDGGVYLLTGGAGGIGLLLAREISDRVQAPVLILTGRSILGEARRAELEQLQTLGAQVDYRQVDVTDAEQVSRLIGGIMTDYGKLDGIFHGAGVIRDNLLQKKTVPEMLEVIAPKAQGLVLLDEASQSIPLDFMIAFSSVAGAMGNPAQTDYSAANAFLDAYAVYRNSLTASGRRHGRMLSVNWPLWKDGGMQVGLEVEKIMLQSLGTVPMPTRTGMEALYRSWASGRDQVMIQVGRLSRIRPRLLPVVSPLSAPARTKTAPAAKQDAAGRLEQVQTLLTAAVSRLLMVKQEEIDVHSELGDYGFDSISFTQFANRLNDDLHLELTPTLFFEYTTVHEVAEYLIAEYPGHFGGEDPDVPEEEAEAVPVIVEYAEEAESVPTPPGRIRLRPGGKAPLPAAPGVEETGSVPEKGEAAGASAEPIAIVGMSGRFPKAEDVHEFWHNLMEGKNCIDEIPEERWDWRSELEGTAEPEDSGLRWGGFINGVENFDPLFFSISPREAEMMDPQQRLLLMEVWKAIEDAGVAPKSLSERPTGVFVAAGPGDYMGLVSINKDNPQAMTGVVPSLIPNRISYALDLKGPSEYCETACSSTLVALHHAVRSIRLGECEQAIVGAVNLLISPVGFTGFDAMGYLSPSGQAKSFQPEADGFVRSEGVGALLIKPLSQAQKDGNPVYALIRGTGVAHGGAGMSLTSPHAAGMKSAMAQAFKDSGIHPRTVSYIEAHGIASPMADGIEVAALKSGYLELAAERGSADSPEESVCFISSLKPGMGHAEVASGLASLIKAVQAIRHRVIPAVQGFTALHPQISLEESPFRITGQHQSWEPLQAGDGGPIPRRAAINSYGIGGVNAHVLIEEYAPPLEASSETGDPRESQVVILSAKNKQRLAEAAQRLHDWVRSNGDLRLPDLAYTLQIGREWLESRFAFVVNSREELLHGLAAYAGFLDRSTTNGVTVPLFTGEVRGSGAAGKPSTPVEAEELEELLRMRKLDVLARKWTEGAVIPWELLHQGRRPRRISLPTYPFEQRRCWPLPDTIGSRRIGKAAAAETAGSSKAAINYAGRVTEIVSRLLGMLPSELYPNTPLDQYGMDSILWMQLLRELQRELDPSFDLMKLQECGTLEEVQSAVQRYAEATPLASGNTKGHAIDVTPFPELILLNHGSDGPPVFWFHGGLGGVEMYQALAQTSRRPFYGIQARGWMTGRSPLQGIGAMAAYYVHILLQVQPEGPYDLGGYSLGGVIAYEVVRQLQELGKTVNTVVMLDSPYGPAFQQGAVSRTSAVLQAVNLALASKHFQQPEQFAQTLIHRDEVTFGLEEGELLQQLIGLGSGRGLTKTAEQLQAMIEANVKIQHAYQFDRYTAMPLPDPHAVTCYYFRNKRGLIFGELEPYFSTTEDSTVLDRAAYWKEWERQFANLHMIDVDASNHMVLLSEARSYERIFEFCERLYSGGGITYEFLEGFKDKMKQLHGVRV
ncbi:SDR family NAD(P)-dependent oxidoreductase [Paenibacillus mucilaginosus]|uniref:Mixed polyketide synthase/non-ribosomal peptide synthetase n=1 Tax=Paenibacillus mucilaginosus (strain KNP414) TaxID=1036673 RepID=F8FQZ7_PAEMK|nr:SDR family NAD(P)-dependent oxidoreductase [Paenibacillus mucilaginosus]AEI40435.1 hypothetical protein KNP414_01873 [Paenibacillus mucilaginosus KNP414]MCG7213220.1 SDR family NAD(P)-dependent oxidoreductase [Paenibacillus mucilaginosus]WDM29614.1 SDR family NAD(P)-dependent oxidoreductase [Paenibacillus mucilaginosus]